MARRLVIGIVALVVVLAIIAGQSGNKKAVATPVRPQAATATLTASSTPASAAATTSVGSPVSADQIFATPIGATAVPTPQPSQVVTVKEDAVNLRQSADVAAAVVTLVPPGTDATVIGEDTTGPDGATRYVHARVGGQEGYLRSDLVSAPHVVTPAPPTATAGPAEAAATITARSNATDAALARLPSSTPMAPSASSLAALQAWSSTYGYIIGAIGSDDDAVAQAASAQSFPALLTTCRQLASDTATAQSFPPIPDTDTATHLRLAYDYQAQSARDCITGVNNVDPTSLRKSGAEAQLAASELNLATASLKRAAGLP